MRASRSRTTSTSATIGCAEYPATQDFEGTIPQRLKIQVLQYGIRDEALEARRIAADDQPAFADHAEGQWRRRLVQRHNLDSVGAELAGQFIDDAPADIS